MTENSYTITHSSNESPDGRVTPDLPLRLFHATENREGIADHARTVAAASIDGRQYPLSKIDVLNIRDSVNALPPVTEANHADYAEGENFGVVWSAEPAVILGTHCEVVGVGHRDGTDEDSLTIAFGILGAVTLSPAAQAQLAAMLTSSVADTLRG